MYMTTSGYFFSFLLSILFTLSFSSKVQTRSLFPFSSYVGTISKFPSNMTTKNKYDIYVNVWKHFSIYFLSDIKKLHDCIRSLLSFFDFLFSSYFFFLLSFFFFVLFIISFSSNVQTRSLFEIKTLFPFSYYVSTFCKHLKVVQLLFFFYSLPYFPFLPQH